MVPQTDSDRANCIKAVEKKSDVIKGERKKGQDPNPVAVFIEAS